MKRFRVAHVITRLCKGGAQENTVHTVRLANQGRFDVDLISGPTTGPEGSIEPEVLAAGIEIVRIPNLVRDVAPIRDLRAARQLAAVFTKNRYDIVHTHTSKAGFVGRLAAKRAGTPIVVHTPHGNIFDGYFGRWPTAIFVALERLAARWTDRIVELTQGGINESLAQRIGDPRQYVSIFSGIDVKSYNGSIGNREEVRRKLDVANGDILIGTVGRLEHIKGFTYFVQAAKETAATNPRTRFVVVGQGSLEGDLRAQAIGLGPRIQFLGLRKDVPDLMAAFDLLVAPSLNEGMGRVILEAGAAGTPVIASWVGGVPDVVKDGITGVLIPPKNGAAIAAAIESLTANPEQRLSMGQAARAWVAQFSIEEMVMRIEALYEELIKEKGLDA